MLRGPRDSVQGRCPTAYLKPLPDYPLAQPAGAFVLPVNSYGSNSFAANHKITSYNATSNTNGTAEHLEAWRNLSAASLVRRLLLILYGHKLWVGAATCSVELSPCSPMNRTTAIETFPEPDDSEPYFGRCGYAIARRNSPGETIKNLSPS
jgi:hypothetical protein